MSLSKPVLKEGKLCKKLKNLQILEEEKRRGKKGARKRDRVGETGAVYKRVDWHILFAMCSLPQPAPHAHTILCCWGEGEGGEKK